MLATTFADLQIKIDGCLFFIGANINVFVLLNWIEVAKLVQLHDRVFPVNLVIDVAFVYQHFPAQDVIAGESVADELQPAQGELLAFFNGDHKVDYSLVGILWIVFESRYRLRCVFDKTLAAIILFQVFK